MTRTSTPPTRADLAPEEYRWYSCPACLARVPVWGNMGVPWHCKMPESPPPGFPISPLSLAPGDKIRCSPCTAGSGLEDGSFRKCGCGATFPSASGRRGRPREHCSEACRELAAARAILGKHLREVQDRATPEAWLSMRSEIQALYFRRPWNRGVKRKAPTKRYEPSGIPLRADGTIDVARLPELALPEDAPWRKLLEVSEVRAMKARFEATFPGIADALHRFEREERDPYLPE